MIDLPSLVFRENSEGIQLAMSVNMVDIISVVLLVKRTFNFFIITLYSKKNAKASLWLSLNGFPAGIL